MKKIIFVLLSPEKFLPSNFHHFCCYLYRPAKAKATTPHDASDKSNFYLAAIKHLSEGQSSADVAKMLFLTPEEVKTAVEDFQKDGLEAFSRKKWYKRKKPKDTPSDPPEDKPGTNFKAHELVLTEKEKAELKDLLKGRGLLPMNQSLSEHQAADQHCKSKVALLLSIFGAKNDPLTAWRRIW